MNEPMHRESLIKKIREGNRVGENFLSINLSLLKSQSFLFYFSLTITFFITLISAITVYIQVLN